MTYVVTGATGNTGKIVAERLLKAGEEVKVISRSEAKLEDLIGKGAIPAVGDLLDADFVKETLKGADGIYAMIPPNFTAKDFPGYQKEVADNLATGAAEGKVKYAVTLSSYGAHAQSGLGVVSGLYPFEQLFNDLPDTQVVHLRAGYFYDNFFSSIPVIKNNGVLGGFPIEGDVPLEMVYTADIGNAAADLLMNRDFEGKEVLFLAHESRYTLNEAARILGMKIDRPNLSYIAFPPESAKEAMMGFGMSESLAENYLKFSQGANSGKLIEANAEHPKRNAPTSLEDFASIFAVAFNS